jgi:hypothetical protein
MLDGILKAYFPIHWNGRHRLEWSGVIHALEAIPHGHRSASQLYGSATRSTRGNARVALSLPKTSHLTRPNPAEAGNKFHSNGSCYASPPDVVF